MYTHTVNTQRCPTLSNNRITRSIQIIVKPAAGAAATAEALKTGKRWPDGGSSSCIRTAMVRPTKKTVLASFNHGDRVWRFQVSFSVFTERRTGRNGLPCSRAGGSGDMPRSERRTGRCGTPLSGGEISGIPCGSAPSSELRLLRGISVCGDSSY